MLALARARERQRQRQIKILPIPLNQRKQPDVDNRLQSALTSFCKTAEASRQRNSLITPPASGGHPSGLEASGSNSAGTGEAPMQRAVVESGTGSALGRTGAIERPRTAAEAEELALALVGDLLPPSVQAFITATEHHDLVAASTGQKPPAAPALTEEERAVVSQSVKSLTEILQPARERGPELEIVVGKLFSGFNVFSGDEAKLKAQVLVWCEELEEFPLYAIRKAYKWAVRSEKKLPTLAAFIADVRLAVGSGVLERHRLLKKLAS